MSGSALIKEGLGLMHATSILHFEGWGFPCVLGATVAYQLLTGRISMRGLLLRKDNSNSVSPGQVQLLLTTLVVSANYLISVAHATGSTLPDVSPQGLYLMLGSSAIHVFEKAFTTLKSMTTGLEGTR